MTMRFCASYILHKEVGVKNSELQAATDVYFKNLPRHFTDESAVLTMKLVPPVFHVNEAIVRLEIVPVVKRSQRHLNSCC